MVESILREEWGFRTIFYAYLTGLTATARDLLDQFWGDPPNAPTVRVCHGERPQ
ncbi:hypothetical protein Sulac_0505 [Sulfobacillus acidophilus DSM 10332]|uniref:Uncharacterized protein n=1 Tax=Sulfobacillus acidophilus (strain ATCC 700253 / DSM 10332 / NAL) TaxID=679936 RepID=G8TYT6_SULAD|nr:hypothetical protein Sulac_0505 [Sulfobacillus acidophilus DSM 10332]